MPHLACFLVAGIVDRATYAKLQHWLDLVPPSYLFYAAVGLLFLGLLLRARGVATLTWGVCLAVSVLGWVLWGAAVLMSLFVHRTHEERKGVPPPPPVAAAAASTGPALDGPCTTRSDCAKSQVCAKVGSDTRCRNVCAKGKPCEAGFSCVVPESGPTVCYPDTQLPH